MTDSKTPTDPALDALRTLGGLAARAFGTRDTAEDALATIRAALADRITPEEAGTVLDWEGWEATFNPVPPSAYRRALIARLGKTAEQDQ
jgi:hypothetical protein